MSIKNALVLVALISLACIYMSPHEPQVVSVQKQTIDTNEVGNKQEQKNSCNYSNSDYPIQIQALLYNQNEASGTKKQAILSIRIKTVIDNEQVIFYQSLSTYNPFTLFYSDTLQYLHSMICQGNVKVTFQAQANNEKVHMHNQIMFVVDSKHRGRLVWEHLGLGKRWALFLSIPYHSMNFNFSKSDEKLNESQLHKNIQEKLQMQKIQRSQNGFLWLIVLVSFVLYKVFFTKVQHVPQPLEGIIQKSSPDFGKFIFQQVGFKLLPTTDWRRLYTVNNPLQHPIIAFKVIQQSNWPIKLGIKRYPQKPSYDKPETKINKRIALQNKCVNSIVYGSNCIFEEDSQMVLGQGKGFKVGETVQIEVRGARQNRTILWSVDGEIRYKAGVFVENLGDWRWVVEMRGNGDQLLYVKQTDF